MNVSRLVGVMAVLSSFSVMFVQAQSTFVVTNADDTVNPPGTLRWAIEQANSDPDRSVIEFQLDGGGGLARCGNRRVADHRCPGHDRRMVANRNELSAVG